MTNPTPTPAPSEAVSTSQGFPLSGIIGLSVCGAFGLMTLACFIWMWRFTIPKKKQLELKKLQLQQMQLNQIQIPKKMTTDTTSKKEEQTKKRLEPLIGSARLRAALVNSNNGSFVEDIIDCDSGGMAAADAGFFHQFRDPMKSVEIDVRVPQSIRITDGEVERRCITPPKIDSRYISPVPLPLPGKHNRSSTDRPAPPEKRSLNNGSGRGGRQMMRHWPSQPQPIASGGYPDQRRTNHAQIRMESSIDAASRAVKDVEEFLVSRPASREGPSSYFVPLSKSKYSNVFITPEPQLAYMESALYGTGGEEMMAELAGVTHPTTSTGERTRTNSNNSNSNLGLEDQPVAVMQF